MAAGEHDSRDDQTQSTLHGFALSRFADANSCKRRPEVDIHCPAKDHGGQVSDGIRIRMGQKAVPNCQLARRRGQRSCRPSVAMTTAPRITLPPASVRRLGISAKNSTAKRIA